VSEDFQGKMKNALQSHLKVKKFDALMCQPKHPKKKKKQGTKWKDPCPRRQMNHPRGQTKRGTSSSPTELLN